MTSAAAIAKALGGRRRGREFMAKCPAHSDTTPSLSIRDSASGKVLIHCHAGCEQSAVISILRDRGLWDERDYQRPSLQIVGRQFNADDEARKVAALAIWNVATPAAGTLVEIYLRSRRIMLPAPDSIRFHGELSHHPSGSKWPAMVALTSDVDGKPTGIHRTYLAADGKGKAPITPAKMALGSCRHGAVRLDAIRRNEWLFVAEGIETALSVRHDGAPTWAALSADGMKNIKLPPEAKMVTLCADNDANGVGQGAAQAVGKRLVCEGRRVRIAIPRILNADWNDVLLKLNETADGG